MKNKQTAISILCFTGIYLVMLPLLLKATITLPDTFTGFITGCGIGMELLGVLLLTKSNHQ